MTEQTRPLSEDQKNFKPTLDLSYGDVWASVNQGQPYFIDIRIDATCLYEHEARVLRDWLNKVLP